MKVFIVGDYTMQMEEIKIQFERYLIFSGKDQLTVLRRDRFNAAKSGFTDDSRFVFFLPVQERYAVYDDADVANSFKLEIDEVQPEKVVIILAYRQSTDTGRLRHSEVEKLWSNGPQKALRDFDDKGRILTCKDSLNDFQVERLREILQLEVKSSIVCDINLLRRLYVLDKTTSFVPGKGAEIYRNAVFIARTNTNERILFQQAVSKVKNITQLKGNTQCIFLSEVF
eukprot:m.23454 g.23454  ORF g.23454 m.23454 type:complete len:227 (+) comp28478_c0_seq3:118-798(+)